MRDALMTQTLSGGAAKANRNAGSVVGDVSCRPRFVKGIDRPLWSRKPVRRDERAPRRHPSACAPGRNLPLMA